MTAIFRLAPLALLLLSGCAHGRDFDYPYYGIHPSKGVLLGSKEKLDIPLTVCEPDEKIKGKCVVLDVLTWERIRADMIRLKHEMKALEEEARRP
jgi:hypothetical protein